MVKAWVGQDEGRRESWEADWLNGLGAGQAPPCWMVLTGQPLQLLLPATRRSLGIKSHSSLHREPLQGEVARIHNVS